MTKRTVDALRTAKARGKKLGGLQPRSLPRVEAIKAKADSDAMKAMISIGPLRAAGQNLSQIAAYLNDNEFATSRGGKWTAKQVSRILERVAGRDQHGDG